MQDVDEDTSLALRGMKAGGRQEHVDLSDMLGDDGEFDDDEDEGVCTEGCIDVFVPFSAQDIFTMA
jgi:hypothetical protein